LTCRKDRSSLETIAQGTLEMKAVSEYCSWGILSIRAIDDKKMMRTQSNKGEEDGYRRYIHNTVLDDLIKTLSRRSVETTTKHLQSNDAVVSA
jgi:hypothetical protein